MGKRNITILIVIISLLVVFRWADQISYYVPIFTQHSETRAKLSPTNNPYDSLEDAVSMVYSPIQCATQGTWQKLPLPSSSETNNNNIYYVDNTCNRYSVDYPFYRWTPSNPSCSPVPRFTLTNFCSSLQSHRSAINRTAHLLILGDSISCGLFKFLHDTFAPEEPCRVSMRDKEENSSYNEVLSANFTFCKSGMYFDLPSTDCARHDVQRRSPPRISFVLTTHMADDEHNVIGFQLPTKKYPFRNIFKQATIILFNIGAHLAFRAPLEIPNMMNRSLQLLIERMDETAAIVFRTTPIGHMGCELSPLTHWTSLAISKPGLFATNAYREGDILLSCVSYLKLFNISHLKPLPTPQSVQWYLTYCNWFGSSRFRFQDAEMARLLNIAKKQQQRDFLLLDVYHVSSMRMDSYNGIIEDDNLYDCLHMSRVCSFPVLSVWMELLMDLLGRQ
jgi:hypothetical protein